MRIAFLNWRDSTHPEGGGAEKYAETVCAGLAARGHDVSMFCARHPGSAAEEMRASYRVLRQGGRLGVYAATLRRLRALPATTSNQRVPLPGTAEQWTEYSCRVVLQPGFYPARAKLDDKYVKTWMPVLEKSLVQAGADLANVLNTALAG